jgi:hypothetical protein
MFNLVMQDFIVLFNLSIEHRLVLRTSARHKIFGFLSPENRVNDPHHYDQKNESVMQIEDETRP